MAKLTMSDVVEPEVWRDYIIARTPEKNSLMQAGIVVPDPEISQLMGMGSRTINMPFWKDLQDESDEVLSDSASLSDSNIATGQDIAVQNFRGKLFKWNDLAVHVSGDDPAGAILGQIVDFWNAKLQDVAVSICKGLFGSGGTLESTHVNDITSGASSATDANKFSSDAFNDAVFKLGDRQDLLTGMLCHSTVYKNMRSQGLVEDFQPNDLAPVIPLYQGRRIFVDDRVPTEADEADGDPVFYTLIFGRGAFGFGETAPPKPGIETDRDIAAGDDLLATRRYFVLHPRGVKFTSNTVAGASPTNAEFETAANWSKVYKDKQVRIVALKSNG